jgi:hypothetical protein
MFGGTAGRRATRLSTQEAKGAALRSVGCKAGVRRMSGAAYKRARGPCALGESLAQFVAVPLPRAYALIPLDDGYPSR